MIGRTFQFYYIELDPKLAAVISQLWSLAESIGLGLYSSLDLLYLFIRVSILMGPVTFLA